MAPEAAERRLAAIMFTDIVGYTALMARDEEAARRGRTRHEAFLRPLVERYHDEWIEEKGSGSAIWSPGTGTPGRREHSSP